MIVESPKEIAVEFKIDVRYNEPFVCDSCGMTIGVMGKPGGVKKGEVSHFYPGWHNFCIIPSYGMPLAKAVETLVKQGVVKVVEENG